MAPDPVDVWWPTGDVTPLFLSGPDFFIDFRDPPPDARTFTLRLSASGEINVTREEDDGTPDR